MPYRIVNLVHLDRVVFQDSIVEGFAILVEIVIGKLADLKGVSCRSYISRCRIWKRSLELTFVLIN